MTWADAQTNLPNRARWYATADAASSEATKRSEASALFLSEGYVLSESAIPTAIDAATATAYRETRYCVLVDGLWTEADGTRPDPFDLVIDQPSTALKSLYAATRHTQCAFITACNPLSQVLSDEANDVRQARLREELTQRSLKFMPGIGQHPTNGWPGEPSFLVLGIALQASKALGLRHQQNAIVWAGPDATPRLILLR